MEAHEHGPDDHGITIMVVISPEHGGFVDHGEFHMMLSELGDDGGVVCSPYKIDVVHFGIVLEIVYRLVLEHRTYYHPESTPGHDTSST